MACNLRLSIRTRSFSAGSEGRVGSFRSRLISGVARAAKAFLESFLRGSSLMMLFG